MVDEAQKAMEEAEALKKVRFTILRSSVVLLCTSNTMKWAPLMGKDKFKG